MSKPHPEADITRLLALVRQGDEVAEGELAPLIYGELRRLAEQRLRRERADHTLQATALVHETYIRLLGREGPGWQDRAHFFAVAARVMRQILIDYARSRGADKRGGAAVRVPMDENLASAQPTWENLLALDQALDALADCDKRQARVVELRFFGGLDIAQTAEVLGVSERTVKRDWEFAQSWLYNKMTARP
jgi:RNA polymerase sigma factor (TIGR02999 family)